MKNIDILVGAYNKVKESTTQKLNSVNKQWKNEQQDILDSWLENKKKAILESQGIPYTISAPNKEDIKQEITSSERMTPVGPVIPEKAVEFLADKSYRVIEDLYDKDVEAGKINEALNKDLKDNRYFEQYDYFQALIDKGQNIEALVSLDLMQDTFKQEEVKQNNNSQWGQLIKD
jgi:hypothetical protein